MATGSEIVAWKKELAEQELIQRTDCPECGWTIEEKDGKLHCPFCGWVSR